ncbi:hypothetical protein GpartN1_g4650.t1 [Galdieria partita]|uniref:Uncharacterized protein n=1 Tax=Galdieria partita TaxID=83374 RepID=A0A9C7PZ68_9RHOD|nr:hypothetical protein GpartN1_g4650.t1 [Galdieria partita]
MLPLFVQPCLGNDKQRKTLQISHKRMVFIRNKHFMEGSMKIPGLVVDPGYRCQSSSLPVLVSCCRASRKNQAVLRNWVVILATLLLSGSIFPVFPGSYATKVLEPVAAASLNKKKARELLKERTKNVKVYMVANQAGQPFLAEGIEANTQVGLFFFTAADASMMLMQMSQGAGGNARVEAISLDKAYDMVTAKPTPSGLKDPKGRDLKVVFRFCPEVSQVRFYRQVAKNKSLRSVPVFVAPDLMLEKNNQNLIPAFLDKEDLERSWKELKKTHPELPLRPKIEAVDLLDVLEEMEKGTNPDIYQLGFYAPRKNLVWVQGNHNHADTVESDNNRS